MTHLAFTSITKIRIRNFTTLVNKFEERRFLIMEERFPDVDWFCDYCNAHLNDQKKFADHKYIWPCTECGFKNSISSANIIG